MRDSDPDSDSSPSFDDSLPTWAERHASTLLAVLAFGTLGLLMVFQMAC